MLEKNKHASGFIGMKHERGGVWERRCGNCCGGDGWLRFPATRTPVSG